MNDERFCPLCGKSCFRGKVGLAPCAFSDEHGDCRLAADVAAVGTLAAKLSDGWLESPVPVEVVS